MDNIDSTEDPDNNEEFNYDIGQGEEPIELEIDALVLHIKSLLKEASLNQRKGIIYNKFVSDCLRLTDNQLLISITAPVLMKHCYKLETSGEDNDVYWEMKRVSKNHLEVTVTTSYNCFILHIYLSDRHLDTELDEIPYNLDKYLIEYKYVDIQRGFDNEFINNTVVEKVAFSCWEDASEFMVELS